MNLKRFIEASEKLYNSLSLPDKSELLNFKEDIKKPYIADNMFKVTLKHDLARNK